MSSSHRRGATRTVDMTKKRWESDNRLDGSVEDGTYIRDRNKVGKASKGLSLACMWTVGQSWWLSGVVCECRGAQWRGGNTSQFPSSFLSSWYHYDAESDHRSETESEKIEICASQAGQLRY